LDGIPQSSRRAVEACCEKNRDELS
jgi:hypothetical protein